MPGEFDLDLAAAGNGDGFTLDNDECAVEWHQPNGAHTHGKDKLEPEHIHITADGLGNSTCTVEVFVKTDSKFKKPGSKSKSPAFTPTSCDGGTIILNDGVKVYTGAFGSDNFLFNDDDTLELDCVFP